MKKLLLALLLCIPLVASSRMFPHEVPIQSICWDSWEEAIKYHKEVLEEHPVGKGLMNNPNGPTFATVTVNPTKPSWSYIHFHHNTETGEQVVCAMAGGTEWEVIIPDFGNGNKVEI